MSGLLPAYIHKIAWRLFVYNKDIRLRELVRTLNELLSVRILDILPLIIGHHHQPAYQNLGARGGGHSWSEKFAIMTHACCSSTVFPLLWPASAFLG